MKAGSWQYRVLGVIAPFLIIGSAYIVHRYVWSFASSLLDILAVLLLAGFVTGYFFGRGAIIYATAGPSLLLTLLSTVQEQFGIGISSDFSAYWLLALFVPLICVPLGVGALFGQRIAEYTARGGIQVNWSRLRDWI